jgi:hypothetical protein
MEAEGRSRIPPPFRFTQFEFGFLLGPPDGRYLVRGGPDGTPQSVIAVRTLGAPERRLLGGRRPRKVVTAEPEPVPTSRVTVIAAEPFASALEAEAWLAALKRDRDALAAEARLGAAEDPWAVVEVAPPHALVVRVGYGIGELVAEGRFDDALELPRTEVTALSRARRGDPVGPGERVAALLSGRDELLACEELVLRARADVEAHRPREAALQARVALEAVLAELPSDADPELAASRAEIGDAANAALRGDPPEHLQRAVAQAVERMERALRRRPPPPEPGG